ncbi:hypothetical protein G3578_09955 [Brevibacillus sp. SYP-B805]|uniref:hypothetical protein n=1 Tax=Brevibacillus sp. SYP-B805 TaxID=1578199 RepID=UPI0013ECDBD8|nr:hypothetical protein [Brevibacillus sp. SYP-B805]NGQ95475.1 hypothetical protein [Brevibacillus sp. SYP-B805]
MFRTGDKVLIDPASEHYCAGEIRILGEEIKPGVFRIGKATETRWDHGQSSNYTFDVVFDSSIHRGTAVEASSD